MDCIAQKIGNQITKSFTSRSLIQLCPLFSSDEELLPADGFSVAFVKYISCLCPVTSGARISTHVDIFS